MTALRLLRHLLTQHLLLRRTCSKPAVGFETKVAITIAEEGFSTTGLMVTERNWLDVYPYANWGGNANLPVFQQGQQFIPQEVMLRQVRLWQSGNRSNATCHDPGALAVNLCCLHVLS